MEKFFSLERARTLNVWFLAIVASWRVALLFFYLRRHARLRPFAIVISALLPITASVVTLFILNLDRAVFDFMGGERGQPGADDLAYAVLFLLSMLSLLIFLPLVICYIFLIVLANFKDAESGVASDD